MHGDRPLRGGHVGRSDLGDPSVDTHAIAGRPTSRSAESEGVATAPATCTAATQEKFVITRLGVSTRSPYGLHAIAVEPAERHHRFQHCLSEGNSVSARGIDGHG